MAMLGSYFTLLGSAIGHGLALLYIKGKAPLGLARLGEGFSSLGFRVSYIIII